MSTPPSDEQVNAPGWEAIDIWVVLGGSVILAAVTFITWREAVLKRRAITPPDSATKV